MPRSSRNIILFGEDKDQIKRNISKEKLFEAKDLKEATEIAKKITLSNEVILLSQLVKVLMLFQVMKKGDMFLKKWS